MENIIFMNLNSSLIFHALFKPLIGFSNCIIGSSNIPLLITYFKGKFEYFRQLKQLFNSIFGLATRRRKRKK